MLALPEQRMTVEEFLEWVQHQDGHFELVEGYVVPKFEPLLDKADRAVGMAGGTFEHATVAANILTALKQKLRGTGCRVLGSDFAIRTGETSSRFPEVSIFCDPVELAEAKGKTALEKPCAVFEVLSRSTSRVDRVDKLMEYQALPSIDTIVLVHPVKRWMSVYERRNENEWRNLTLVFGRSLELRGPTVTLTSEEIFDGV